MAVVRARTAPPYALIAFIALWVVSTILAVLFYLQWNKADKDRQDVLRDSAKIYSSADKLGAIANINSQVNDERRYPTTIAKAEFLIEGLTKMITNNPNTPYSGTVAFYNNAQADATAKAKHAGSALADTVTLLAGDVAARTSQNDKNKDSIASLTSQLKDAIANDQKQIEGLNNTNHELQRNLATAQGEVAKAQQEKNDAIAASQDQIDKAMADADSTVRKGALQVQELKGQVAGLQGAIKELQTRIRALGGVDRPDVGVADGKIVRTNPALNEVYIDLKDSDRLSPGLTFTVYDPRNGVHYGSDAEAMGKGSIEVIEPGPQVSLCRITHTTLGQSIQPGDLISNVVYSTNKSRKLRFVVFGDVDLDGDNKATTDEHDRLVRLINLWGGQVDDEITAQTDYLVVGAEPTAISTGDDNVTPGSVADMRNKQIEQYHHLINQASSLSVPILNINRFMSMIGYYSTTVVRY